MSQENKSDSELHAMFAAHAIQGILAIEPRYPGTNDRSLVGRAQYVADRMLESHKEKFHAPDEEPLANNTWIKVSEITPGTWVKVYGIPCIGDDGTTHPVFRDNDGQLYIDCATGSHFLSGQRESGYYVGLVLYEPIKVLYTALKRGSVFKLKHSISTFIKLDARTAYNVTNKTVDLMPDNTDFEVELIA